MVVPVWLAVMRYKTKSRFKEPALLEALEMRSG